MEQVLAIAEQTGTVGQSVLAAAEDVGRTSITLRVEVNDFVNTTKRGEIDEPRSYERILGDGAKAKVIVQGMPEEQPFIRISHAVERP